MSPPMLHGTGFGSKLGTKTDMWKVSLSESGGMECTGSLERWGTLERKGTMIF